jgi:tetratricopeptide (TPR) repeat protein
MMMRTIYADFNATAPDGHVCLTTLGSQEDIRRDGVEPGDWVWLSDGELIVGAQVATDEYFGLVGIPDWETLVHLDDEGADDLAHVRGELQPLLQSDPDSIQGHARVFQLITQLERLAPGRLPAEMGDLLIRRALALRSLGRTALAMLEILDAREARPQDPLVLFFYLDLLRCLDMPRAVSGAESLVLIPDLPAVVLTACIMILATVAEEASEDRFEPIARRVLDWCDRLMRAPDLRSVEPSLVAMSYFNRGVMLLRLGRTAEAQDAFRRAHEIYPLDTAFDEATRLDTYDSQARELAHRVRDRTMPIAA